MVFKLIAVNYLDNSPPPRKFLSLDENIMAAKVCAMKYAA